MDSLLTVSLSQQKSRSDPGEEEITSESDGGGGDDDDEEKDSTNKPDLVQHQDSLKRKIKWSEYPDFMAKRHKSFQQFR